MATGLKDRLHPSSSCSDADIPKQSTASPLHVASQGPNDLEMRLSGMERKLDQFMMQFSAAGSLGSSVSTVAGDALVPGSLGAPPIDVDTAGNRPQAAPLRIKSDSSWRQNADTPTPSVCRISRELDLQSQLDVVDSQIASMLRLPSTGIVSQPTLLDIPDCPALPLSRSVTGTVGSIFDELKEAAVVSARSDSARSPTGLSPAVSDGDSFEIIGDDDSPSSFTKPIDDGCVFELVEDDPPLVTPERKLDNSELEDLSTQAPHSQCSLGASPLTAVSEEVSPTELALTPRQLFGENDKVADGEILKYEKICDVENSKRIDEQIGPPPPPSVSLADRGGYGGSDFDCLYNCHCGSSSVT